MAKVHTWIFFFGCFLVAIPLDKGLGKGADSDREIVINTIIDFIARQSAPSSQQNEHNHTGRKALDQDSMTESSFFLKNGSLCLGGGKKRDAKDGGTMHCVNVGSRRVGSAAKKRAKKRNVKNQRTVTKKIKPKQIWGNNNGDYVSYEGGDDDTPDNNPDYNFGDNPDNNHPEDNPDGNPDGNPDDNADDNSGDDSSSSGSSYSSDSSSSEEDINGQGGGGGHDSEGPTDDYLDNTDNGCGIFGCGMRPAWYRAPERVFQGVKTGLGEWAIQTSGKNARSRVMSKGYSDNIFGSAFL